MKGSIKGANKLPNPLLESISVRLDDYNGKMPTEFARQPRSLEHLDRWKATEFRTFLLYTGVVVFRGIVSPQVYKHFLALCIAFRFLCTEDTEVRNRNLGNAKVLLKYFVHNCDEHYGDIFCVYNIHNLLHIVDDVSFHNAPLDKLSAFPFENYFYELKKLVRSRHNPLVQVVKRVKELERLLDVRREHTHNILLQKNSCFLTDHGIVFVKRKRPRMLVADLYIYRHTHNFFNDFIDSKEIDIYFLGNNVVPTTVNIDDSQRKRMKKCVYFKYKHGKVILAMLHSMGMRFLKLLV